MIKCVIFDLDGTLLDTLGDLHETMNVMLTYYNFPTVELQRSIDNIGHGAEEYVIGCLPEDKRYMSKECLAVYKYILVSSGQNLTKTFEGIDNALEILKNKGFKLAILTNKPHAVAIETCNKFFKPDLFEYIEGHREEDNPKPDPTVLNRILKALDVDKNQVVMIGDGEADVLVAKNANVKNIAVLWGYRTKKQLKQAGADNFAVNTNEMIKLIENL